MFEMTKPSAILTILLKLFFISPLYFAFVTVGRRIYFLQVSFLNSSSFVSTSFSGTYSSSISESTFAKSSFKYLMHSDTVFNLETYLLFSNLIEVFAKLCLSF